MAVTVTAWPVETEAAVTVNAAEVAPAGTVSDAGAGSAGLLEISATEAPPEGAGPLRMILQAVEPPGAKLDGLHATEFRSSTGAAGAAGAGGAKATTVFCELPLSAAVIVALWLVLTVAALAANGAELEPAATVMDDGTVSAESLLLNATAAPPVGAAPLSETEQFEVAGVTTEDELQESPLTVTGVATEIPPPVLVAAIAAPTDEEAVALVNPRLSVPAVAETVTSTVATTPSGIAVWFTPEAIQT